VTRGDRRDDARGFSQCDSEVAVRQVLLDCAADRPRGGDTSSDDSSGSSTHRRRQHGHGSGRGSGRTRRSSSRRSYRASWYDNDRRRRRSREKVRWIKPEKFNGNGSFEIFLVQFENCAAINEWDIADKAAHLRWSLTGSAAQLWWGSERLSYEQLLDKLKHRFSGKGMEEKFQTELRCRRRNRSESLRQLAHDIRRLMTLDNPGEQSSLSEHIARDVFLSALGDPDFELKIREREPTDLDEALTIALRYDVFKGAVESSAATRPK